MCCAACAPQFACERAILPIEICCCFDAVWECLGVRVHIRCSGVCCRRSGQWESSCYFSGAQCCVCFPIHALTIQNTQARLHRVCVFVCVHFGIRLDLMGEQALRMSRGSSDRPTHGAQSVKRNRGGCDGYCRATFDVFSVFIRKAVLCSLRNNKPVHAILCRPMFVRTLFAGAKCSFPAPWTPTRTVLSYTYETHEANNSNTHTLTQSVTLYQFVLLMGMWGGRAIQSVSVRSWTGGGRARVLQLGEQIIVRTKRTSRKWGIKSACVLHPNECVGDSVWA